MNAAAKRIWDHVPDAADMAGGQKVIVTARWILVATALLLAVFQPRSTSELRIQIVFILILAVCNFGLHSQLLRRRPTIDIVAYGASAADIAVITLLVISQGGFASGLYVFYFPAIFALSVAFGTVLTVTYTGLAVFLYGMIGLATAGPDDYESVVVRCLMLAVVAAIGDVYWRIESARRHRSAGPATAPVAD